MDKATFLSEAVGVLVICLIAAALAWLQQISETYRASRAKAGEGR